jgi:hypothetical protein
MSVYGRVNGEGLEWKIKVDTGVAKNAGRGDVAAVKTAEK